MITDIETHTALTPPASDNAVALPSPKWRKMFKTFSEMDSTPLRFPISGFLPPGITVIGAHPASGKTWLCLSMAKALTTGKKFLGALEVSEQSNVLYLIPESGEQSFRQRVEVMGLPDDDRFLCRTMSDEPIELTNSDLISAVQDLKPVVFLDTALRFNRADNENDATQFSRFVSKPIFRLLREGAKAVVCAHHSTKGRGKEMTLESCCRGTGEVGAMADAVYAMEVENSKLLKVKISNKKSRDFEEIPPFVIVGRPYINDEGDFRLEGEITEPEFAKLERERLTAFDSAVLRDRNASFSDLQKELRISRGGLQRLAKKGGWTKAGGSIWIRNPEEIQLAA